MRGNQGAKHGPEVLRNRKFKKKGGTINFKLLMIQTRCSYPALYSTQASIMHKEGIRMTIIKDVSS